MSIYLPTFGCISELPLIGRQEKSDGDFPNAQNREQTMPHNPNRRDIYRGTKGARLNPSSERGRRDDFRAPLGLTKGDFNMFVEEFRAWCSSEEAVGLAKNLPLPEGRRP